MTPSTLARPAGRPRSSAAHQAILLAALELVEEQGVAALTMERVAERARVGKATVYRRWSSTDEIVAEALSGFGSSIQVPNSGSARQDLIELVQDWIRIATARSAGHTFTGLLAGVLVNRRLMKIYWERVVTPRRAALDRIFARGKMRGELRRDLDVELVPDLLVGAIAYQLLIRPPSASLSHFPRRVVNALWPALVSTSGRKRARSPLGSRPVQRPVERRKGGS